MNRQSVIALGLVAVALLAYIIVYERHTLSTGALEGRDNRVAREYVRAQVDRVEIERRGQDPIALVRDREDEDALGSWRMVAPLESAADDDAVGALLGSVDWVDARRRIDALEDGDLVEFGLDEPRVSATFVMGNERLTLAVGGETPGGDGVYVTSDGGQSAVVAGKDLYEALDQDVDHFRSKRLLERGMLTARELRLGDVALTLSDGRWTTADGVRASGNRLDEALQALTDLEARRYLGDESLRGEATVIRAVREAGDDEGDGDVVVELSLGGPCEGDAEQRYAQVALTRDGERTAGPLTCVAERDVEPLLVPADEWRERRPLTLNDLELESMTVTGAAGTLELTDEGSGWTYAMGDQSGSVDEDALIEWLGAIKAHRAQSFVIPAGDEELRSYGLAAPAVTITLRATEDRTETVALGAVTSEGAYLRRDDEPAILIVPAAAAADLEPSVARLRPRQLLELDASDITELAIRRQAATERLTREGEGWALTAPLTMPAADAEVRAVVRDLADLRAVRFVADRAQPDHGLDAPRVDLTFTAREDGDAVEHRLRLGRATDEGAFARLDGDSAVFLVEPGLARGLAGPLVPRDLLATSRYEVTEVQVSEGERTVRLRNDQGSWVTENGPLADDATETFFGALDHLRAAGTSAYGPASAADGLTPPRATIHVVREEGSPEPREYDIVIGAAADAEAVHARRGDLAVGFLLREPVVDALLSPL